MPTGGAVRGAAATLTFDAGRTVTAVQESPTVRADTASGRAEEETS
jgi:hypothetical protein